MNQLINQIEKLKNSKVAKTISNKMKEFEKVDDLFGELCFCLMTAGFRADKCIEIQKNIGDGFINLDIDELKNKLKKMGHRFWPQRAERIVLARKFRGELEQIKKRHPLSQRVRRAATEENRDWLVANISGLGMKESSHFLRNVGFKDAAIIDFHIVDLLKRERLIKEFSNLNKKKYLEIEDILRNLSNKVNLSLGELDLYLWYIETGKVLK